MPHYIGVDAGGSHCRSRLIDERGAVIGTGATGSANARMGVDKLHAVLLDVCKQATDEAGLPPDEIAQIQAGFGIAGISRTGVRQALDELQFPFASCTFDTDAMIANIGAHAGGDGAILIIGTGSIGLGRVGSTTFSVGGYGFPISDEGSGAALGLSAMRHALRALDGRTQRTPLSIAVAERFGHGTAAAVAWMDDATPQDYAALAPLVMDRAEADDPVARSIVEDAALHIERFIEAIFERGTPRCALVGGLAPRMKCWLRQRTVERLSEPMGDALDGALILGGYQGPAVKAS